MSLTSIVYILLVASSQHVVILASDATPPTPSGTQPEPPKQGWTSQPDGRGTLDILWSCAFTMSLCSWSILFLNTPGPHETRTAVLWRKISMTILGVLCPELIFEIACGQWLAARQSVQMFREAGFCTSQNTARKSNTHSLRGSVIADVETLDNQSREAWDMQKAFFAEMGGFRLHTRDRRPFPIDSKQILFLVEKGYVCLPNIKSRVIQDRNKADSLLRAVVICQVLWFLVSTVARWIQGLVVTTAELTTVSFILCSAGTAFCWWRKPADVVTAETLHTNYSWDDILRNAGQPLNEWRLSPLDFISRREWWWSKTWMNFVNLLDNMHVTFGTRETPRDRIPDSEQKELPRQAVFAVLGVTYGFFAVLFAAWNNSFPTKTEQLLWRAACVTMMTSLTALVLSAQLDLTYENLLRVFRKAFRASFTHLACVEVFSQIHRTIVESSLFRQINKMCDSIRNNSKGKDPHLQIRLRVILSMYVIGSLYILARAYVILADVLELRSLPASAYATVNWQKFWPHLG